MEHTGDITGKKDTSARTPFLITDNSMHNADLFYATGFLAGDAFSYLRTDGMDGTGGTDRTGDSGILLVSKMEEGRATSESRIADVRTTSDYGIMDRLKDDRDTAYPSVLFDVMSREGITHINVPKGFPVYIADFLRQKGMSVTPVSSPFELGRRVKNEDEIKAIEDVQRACEAAMEKAVELISHSAIEDGVLYRDAQPLTSEYVRSAIEYVLLGHGCTADDTIVACKSSEPHNRGHGALLADAPIIIDIFPRSKEKRYHSDMSRTVLKGTPSDVVEAMYRDVLDAQLAALSVIKAGVPASDVHNVVCALFEERGHPISGAQGFTHSTGHGVGLEIHEAPAVGLNDMKLEAGNVITVEPGLYYHDAGGVRLEDIVVVTDTGCRNLTHFEKLLVI